MYWIILFVHILSSHFIEATTDPLVGYNVSQTDIDALFELFVSTGGDEWEWRYPLAVYGDIWDFETQPVDPCDRWQGVRCDFVGFSSTSDTSAVSESNSLGTNPQPIHFSSVGTNSSLSLSEQETKYVFNVTLTGFNLFGTIPESIANLTQLRQLDLSNNTLFGEVPRSVLMIERLSYLSLRENSLTGTIPGTILTALSDLKHFDCSANLFSGQAEKLSSSGSSSSSIAANLEFLSLEHNKLSGPLSDAFFQSLPELSSLYIGYNFITSTLPESLASLLKLQIFAINYNYISGNIPSVLGTMPQVDYMYFQENLFSGNVPDGITQMQSLTFLSLYSNDLSGTIPENMGNLTYLRAFTIDDNFMSGTIPPSIGELSLLQQLNLYANYFTGTVPTSFHNLQNLQLLLLQENLLHGSLTDVFDASTQLGLQSIDVSQNGFSGELPIQAFSPNLTSFVAFQNCFEGSIPVQICSSQNLNTLVLDAITSGVQCRFKFWPFLKNSPYGAKKIEGGVPACVWTELPLLQTLHLSGNALTGSIPELSKYAQLENLDLSYNRMHGDLPASLQAWSPFTELNLRNNKFSGEISTIGSLNYSYLPGQPGVNLALTLNRLSGIVPLELLHAEYLDILDGNLFTCTYAHPPPYHDPESANYVCGSNLLDISLYTFASSGAVFIAVVGFISISIAWAIWRKVVPSLHKRESKALQPDSKSSRKSHISTYTAPVCSESGGSTVSAEQCGSSQAKVEGGTIPISRMSMYQFFSKLHCRLSSLRYLTAFIKNLEVQRKRSPGFLVDAKIAGFYVILWWKTADEMIHQEVLRRAEKQRRSVLPLNSCSISLDQSEKTSSVYHLAQFFLSVRLLRRTVLLVLFILLVVSIPGYSLLKVHYGTVKNEYRWEITGAFLQGYVPAACITALWLLLLLIVLQQIMLHVPDRHISPGVSVVADGVGSRFECSENVQNNVSNHECESTLRTDDKCAKENDGEGTESLLNGPPEKGHANAGSKSTVGETSFSSSPIVPEYPTTETALEERSIKLEKFVRSLRWVGILAFAVCAKLWEYTIGMGEYMMKRSVWISIGTMTLDVIVVSALKTTFIFLLLSSDASFEVKMLLEAVLSGIDIIWIVILVPYVINRLKGKKAMGKFMLKVSMLYFNSVIAPVFAIGVTDDSCFSGYFQRQPTYTLTFNFSYCMLYLPGTFSEDCTEHSSWSSTVDFSPAFFYNYGCYSAVITEYVPVFLLSYSFLMIAVPFASGFITSRPQRSWIHECFPKIFYMGTPEAYAQAVSGVTMPSERGGSAISSGTTVNCIHDETAVIDRSSPVGEAPVAVDSAKIVLSRSLETRFRDETKDDPASNFRSSKKDIESPLDQKEANVAPLTDFSSNSSMSSAASALKTNREVSNILFFPGFILASMIHHLIVLLTFGVVCPPLAVAVVLLMCSTSLTWEVIIGRYLANYSSQQTAFTLANRIRSSTRSTAESKRVSGRSENSLEGIALSPLRHSVGVNRKSDVAAAGRAGNEGRDLALIEVDESGEKGRGPAEDDAVDVANEVLKRESSLVDMEEIEAELAPVNSLRDGGSALDKSLSSIEPKFDASKALDKLCEEVWHSPRKSLYIIGVGSAIFYAALIIDMIGDTDGWRKGVPWALAALFMPILFILLLKLAIIPIWRSTVVLDS